MRLRQFLQKSLDPLWWFTLWGFGLLIALIGLYQQFAYEALLSGAAVAAAVGVIALFSAISAVLLDFLLEIAGVPAPPKVDPRKSREDEKPKREVNDA
jgi:hypothetical protein